VATTVAMPSTRIGSSSIIESNRASGVNAI
jgi:hypothetical protein